MKVYILGYKGKSLGSKIIKTVTWGHFSHVCIMKDKTFQVIESRLKGGVQQFDNPWTDHTKNTPIVIFKLKYPISLHDNIWEKAKSKLGLEYDWRALSGFSFITRWFWADDNRKWFCSHQVADDCDITDFHRLFNKTVPLYKIDPSYCVSSPFLEPIGEVRNMKELKELLN